MLPDIELKLLTNTTFKQLTTLAMGSCIKNELDRLTTGNNSGPVNLAEVKLLAWLREKMRTGSVMDTSFKNLGAKDVYVAGLLSMFEDESDDTIEYTLDDQRAITINPDATKPILMQKIMINGYLYGLAGVENEDFGKDQTGAPLASKT